MSKYDAVRNRQRGEEAKQRVLARTYSPKQDVQQESKYAAVRNRKIETPLTDTEKSKIVLDDTLAGVMRPAVAPTSTPNGVTKKPYAIDFKAQNPLQGKVPAASLLSVDPFKELQTNIKDKVPAASLLVPNGGPNLTTEYDIREKAINDTNIPEALKYPSRVINKLAFDTAPGKFISRSFQGNSGVTQRDSTGSVIADKVSDVVNNFVTPFLTPTGAAVGQGLAAAPYDAASKMLSKGLGQKVVNGLASAIPKVSPATAQNIARVGLTEGIAGVTQGVGTGLINGQDSNKEIEMNALYGGVGGLGLGLVGGGLTNTFISKFLKSKGIPEEEVLTPDFEMLPPKQMLALPEGRGTIRQSEAMGRSNLSSNSDPIVNHTNWKPEPLGLPQGDTISPTTARRGTQTNIYKQKFETLIAEARKQEFSPGREDIELDNLWSQMAGRNDPSLDELIDLAYPKRKLPTPQKGMIDNARNYQMARDVYGIGNPVKSSAERANAQVLGEVASPQTIIAKSGVKDISSFSKRQEPVKRSITEPPVKSSLTTEQTTRPNGAYQRLLDATTDKPMNSTPEPMADPTPLKPEPKEINDVIESIQEPRLRDKVYTKLDDAEKAARERIAKRRGQLNSSPLPEWIDYSVIMAAKLGKKTIKISNFTEELVKEFGENIREHSDKILRLSREELRRQERAASEEGINAVAFNAKTEGDVTSFSEKISRTAPKEKKAFSERWQQWRTQATDDLAALEDVEKSVRGGKLASAEDSLYKAARMFKGVPEKASQIVQDRLSPVIKSIEESGYTVEDLEMYALAKHAKDVNAAGYKSGFTNQEIKSVLDELGTDAMDAAQQELVKVNRDMLKNLVDSGVVTKELYDVLGDRWKNYIPLFREMNSEKVNFQGGVSKALANVTSPIKALQGSEKQVIAPLENMVKNIFQSVNAAERNKVAQQIPKLAEMDTNNSFFKKLKPGEEVGQKNVVKVKVEGKDIHYDVEPQVYKALMNLDQESSNTLMHILAKPASLLRAGATLTPEFALRNPLRDINQAFVVSKSGFNPITDFGAGLIQTIKKGPLYKDWIDNLGAYGNTLSMDRNVHKKALETVLKQPKSKKFVNLINGKSLIGALRSISDATESATKVGEYRAALRSGASKEEAAFRSRDLMDFARAGSSIRPANRIVSFLNANIQGKSKLIRSIQENPGGVIARGFVSVTVPTIGIFVANHKFANDTQRATIDNAPDWMKDSFWLMAVPGTDVVARIPKPFDLASIFSNLPEKALQYTLDNDPAAFDGFVQRTLKESSLPTQISGLLPFIEGMANYSFFKEGAIIPRAEQGLKFSDQYDPIRTSTTARIIAGGVEKATGGKGSFKNFSSPRVVDNTIQGLTAGVGKYASNAVDWLLDETGAYDRTEKPSSSLEQKPFVKSFLVDPDQGGKAMDKFYMMKDELTKEKASKKLNNKPFTKQGELDSIGNVSDALSDINKAIKAIERGVLSASEKKERIEPLVKRRNEMIQRTMKYFKEQKS